MRGMRSKALLVAAAAVLAAVFFGCSASEPAKPEAKKEASPPEAVPVPAKLEALVTFVSGDVESLRGGKWNPVGIGDNLSQNAVVKVREQSYCELQFGNTAVIRINENTEIGLEKVALEVEANQVDVKLEKGAVLAKVTKLAGKDKFQVRTGVAICGVRGTEFGVSTSPDGKTLLKVKEGRVAVLPSTADVEIVGRKIQTDEKTAAIVTQAVEKVIEAAPVVQKNEEILVSPETVKKTQDLLVTVQKEMTQLVTKTPEKEEAKNKQIADLAEEVAKRVTKALEKAVALKEESKKELAVMDSMALVKLPSPPPAPQAAAQEKPKEEKKVNLLVVSIAAVPEDAEILVEGNLVGKGDLKRIFEEGTKAVFRVQREGYEPQDVTVEVLPKAKRDFKVVLVPKPKEVTIQADPADAEILVDGNAVGKGTFKGAYPVGKEIKVGVRKPGFEEKATTVKVSLDMAPILKVALGKVSKEVKVTVEPKDAKIFLGAAQIGTGSHQALYYVGDKLQFRFVRPGYQEKIAALEVKEAGDNALNLSLERLRKTVAVTVEPRDAKIALNGKEVGRGSFSGSFDYGESLVFEVSKEGFAARTLSLDVNETVKESYALRLEKERKDLSLAITPKTASVYLDGRLVGTGGYQARPAVGDVLNFVFRQEGYVEKAMTLEVAASTPGALKVELEAKAIFGRIKASTSRIVGLAVKGEDRFVGTDSSGRLFCAALNGKVQWTVQTANSPNESTPAVLAGDRAYFAGSKELVIVNVENGTVLTRKPLDSASANLFGRRPAAHEKGLLFPTNQAVLLLDSATGETLKTVRIGSDCMMSPLYLNGRIYIADQLGKVHVLNAETSQEEASLATQALQPVAQAIQVVGNTGYFSGRRGNVAAFDLAGRNLLWQAKLTEDASAAVFQDLACSASGVFAFSKNTVYGLNAVNGNQLFPALKDVTSPPLLLQDALFYGTQAGNFVMLTLTVALRKACPRRRSSVLGRKPFEETL